MPATSYNITCVQGVDLDLVVTHRYADGTPVNLTGGSARMQVRQNVLSPNPFVDLTSNPAAGLTLGGAAGTITIHIAGSATLNYPFGLATHNLVFTSGAGASVEVLKGKFDVQPSATR